MRNNIINILLIGDRKDEQLATEIINNLKTDYHILYYNSAKTKEYNAKAKKIICIYELEKIERYNNAVIVIKNSAKNISNENVKSDSLLIIDSENQQQIKNFCKDNLSVIVCGLSEKDTITFSSREMPTILVSLQREIEFCENTIEPQEVQINSNCKNKYPILVAGASLIIASNFPF